MKLTAWVTKTGRPIEAGDDGLLDLLNHVIGLGRETYQAALADPSLLATRAEAHDYEESFAYLEQHAWSEVPIESMFAALRVSGSDAGVEDAERGIGLRTSRGVVFAD